jgi:hypothetical protein
LPDLPGVVSDLAEELWRAANANVPNPGKADCRKALRNNARFIADTTYGEDEVIQVLN